MLALARFALALPKPICGLGLLSPCLSQLHTSQMLVEGSCHQLVADLPVCKSFLCAEESLHRIDQEWQTRTQRSNGSCTYHRL